MSSATKLSQDDLDFMAFALEQTPEGSIEEEEDDEISPEELQFAKQAQEGPRPPKEVSRLRSIISAPLKGAYRIAGHALGAMPSGGKTFDETLEDVFPTQEGRFIEGSLQRGAEIGTGGVAKGVGGVILSALAGIVGESINKIPFIPDWLKPYVETAGEIATTGLPRFGSKIRPTASQKPLVEGARKLGLKEKEIAPLIQSEKKVRTLAKTAGKRFRTQKALGKSKTALDKSLELMDAHPDIDRVLAPGQADTTISSIEKKMVNKLNSSERGLIKDDFEILKNSPKSAKDFIKFFRDLNKQISTNPKSRKSLNLLKDDLIESVQKISPELGNTFNVTNKLYSNYSKIAQKLKPSWNEDIARTLGTGVGHVIVGSLFGNYAALGTIIGEQAAKNVAREMLINPRFQNLSRQIVHSLNSGKVGLATQLWDKLGKLMSKESPKLALEMEKVDWESIQQSSDEGIDEKE